MNQQQKQQICLMAQKSRLFGDMVAYKAILDLSDEQAKVINPLSPNVEKVLQFNASMRIAEFSEELLLLDDDDDDDDDETKETEE